MEKRKKFCFMVALFLLILATISLAAYGIFYCYYSKMNIQTEDNGGSEEIAVKDLPGKEIKSYEDYLREKLEAQTEDIPYDAQNVYNVLLIGTDSRAPEENSRSDSMILVSINRKTEKIIMTSIMRDIYCTIPGVGDNRINAACAYGGAPLLLAAIEYNFGIQVDDYAVINFYGFIDAVNAAGGVELEVTAAEIKEMNGWMETMNALLHEERDADKLDESDAGPLLLNGKQALIFSRIRYTGDSDFERTSRQRRVLTALLNKAKSLSFPALNGLLNAVLPCITTNLTQGKVLSLLLCSKEYLDYEVVSGRIPIDGSWSSMNVRGMAVLRIDFSENRDYWYELVYGE